jgi:hypothetical protein
MFEEKLENRSRRRRGGGDGEEALETSPGKSNVLPRNAVRSGQGGSRNVQVKKGQAVRRSVSRSDGRLVALGHDLASTLKRLLVGVSSGLRTLRGFLWIGLFFLGLTGVVIPLLYLYTASQLPELRGVQDVGKQLAMTVEASRRTNIKFETTQKHLGSQAIKYDDPGRTGARPLPINVQRLYSNQWNCPDYLQQPKEIGRPWAWRVFGGLLFGDRNDGPGFCELVFARRLARRLSVEGTLATAIAAHRMHSFLDKPQLMAYDLSSIEFERGIVGIESASKTLFKRDLEQLTLAETAELMLALPPNNWYSTIKSCRGPSVIRASRDLLLKKLEAAGLASAANVKAAMTEAPACTRVP